MNSIIYLKNCKYMSIYYDDMKFYEDNAYIKIEHMSFEINFNRVDRLCINYFCKKSKQSSFISFDIENYLHPEKIKWDIIKNVYSCPMSIKKFIEKNQKPIKRLINTVKKEFRPYFKLYYGY